MKKIYFLEAVQIILIFILLEKYVELFDEKYVLENKFERQVTVMKKWVEKENICSKIENYLCDLKFSRIVIYGMGVVGNRLYNFFKLSNNIEVVYGLDKNAKNIKTNLKIYSLEEHLDKNVDVIVITNIYDCGSIYKELKKIYTETRIISLEEILNSIE